MRASCIFRLSTLQAFCVLRIYLAGVYFDLPTRIKVNRCTPVLEKDASHQRLTKSYGLEYLACTSYIRISGARI
ncbi:hypothetical protein F4811DRAFT_540450 [Daldinia bambusicola]|nr:hypothetical protein F4811DRAFT_540450 [Daldinia bambusicola]